jgi:hypothetical protein
VQFSPEPIVAHCAINTVVSVPTFSRRGGGSARRTDFGDGDDVPGREGQVFPLSAFKVIQRRGCPQSIRDGCGCGRDGWRRDRSRSGGGEWCRVLRRGGRGEEGFEFGTGGKVFVEEGEEGFLLCRVVQHGGKDSTPVRRSEGGGRSSGPSHGRGHARGRGSVPDWRRRRSRRCWRRDRARGCEGRRWRSATSGSGSLLGVTDGDGLVDLVKLGGDLTATLFGIALGCRNE